MPVFPVFVTPGVPGALVDRNYRYEFRGFVFGADTPFQTEKVDGILGLPSARTSDDQNSVDHGDHAGVDLLPGRTITITMNVLAEGLSLADALMDQATLAFQVSKRNAFQEFQFVTQRPTHTKRFCWARARRCEFPSNYDTARGHAVGAVQLYATDPRFFTLAQTVSEIAIPVGLNTSQGIVQMLGNFADGSYPVLEISGPCTNPRIQNTDDGGRTIRIDVVVPNGQSLVIDTKAKTVFLNGVDQYDKVRADNEWWVLVPGNNHIVYDRSGAGASSTCEVRHYDAWTGA